MIASAVAVEPFLASSEKGSLEQGVKLALFAGRILFGCGSGADGGKVNCRKGHRFEKKSNSFGR